MFFSFHGIIFFSFLFLLLISSKTLVSITNRISTLIEAGCRPLASAQRSLRLLFCTQTPLSQSSPSLIRNIHETVVHFYHFFHFKNVVHLPSRVRLFGTPRAAWASQSFTVSRNLLKLMSIESVMPSNHLIPCLPLLLPSVFPSIRVFSHE